jgi:hypothetical protein
LQRQYDKQYMLIEISKHIMDSLNNRADDTLE